MSDLLSPSLFKWADKYAAILGTPSLTIAVAMEFGRSLRVHGLSSVNIYSICVVAGFAITWGIYYVLFQLGQLMEQSAANATAAFIAMPIGFICLVPSLFPGLAFPLTQWSGGAVVIWSLLLLKTSSTKGEKAQEDLTK